MPVREFAIGKPGRVLSVDLLRGVTIALMILVNDPGDWSHVFRQLDHAEWNGWTLTDLVFPTFLFLMGASMVFSLGGRAARGDCRWTQAGHIFARGGKIFLLDLLLAYFPRMQWSGLRLYGVLTRIALCYVLAGLWLLLVRRMRWLALTVVVLLVGYWALLRWVPVPGQAVAFMDKTQNVVAWVDRGVVAWTQRWLHTGTLYNRVRDPEGLLSTLPAVATTLLGAIAGLWMRRPLVEGVKVPRVSMRVMLAAGGAASLCAGLIWAPWFPINKNLWTSSYVLLAAGWAALALAGASWLVDGRGEPWPRSLRVLTWPWFVFGSNAIAAYTVSIVLVKTLIYFKIADADGDRHSLWALIYENVFARHGSTEWTSLLFALSVVAVCLLPNWWLWRRKIFLRI
jgi:predicted acyltransferase